MTMTLVTGSDVIEAFASAVETAESVKASEKGATERKVARQATSLIDLLKALAVEDELQAELASLAETYGSIAAESVDHSEGQELADVVTALVALPDQLRPEGFDEATAAELLARWKVATSRRTRSATGESTTPESQKVPCPIKVKFTYPEGSELKLASTITHDSTWSSVSAEITKRAMALAGLNRGDDYSRPEAAKVAWREATSAIKAGTDDGRTFVVPVATPVGEMIAEVSAVR